MTAIHAGCFSGKISPDEGLICPSPTGSGDPR